MSQIYWPIVMYGVNISEFQPKEIYQDDSIDKEHYVPWDEILEQDDIDPDIDDFLIAHLSNGKDLELSYSTTGTMFSDCEDVYVGVPAYHLFEASGKYYSQFSQNEIRDAIVQVIQRYTDAPGEEILKCIKFIDDVGASN